MTNQDYPSKPQSLKQQALAALHAVASGANDTREQHQDLDTIRRALEQLADETGSIHFSETGSEVIRLDSEGFHYRGEFIADAGEAHRLMVTFLQRHTSMHPEVVEREHPAQPTDEELHQLWLELYASHDGPTSGDVAEIARAALARWGK